MDIVVEVRDAARPGETCQQWPCRVEVGPGDSVEALVTRLDDHVETRGVIVDARTWWTSDGRPLDGSTPAATLADGDTLILAPSPPLRAVAAVELVVDDPAAGPVARLDVGIHRLGGSPDDDVVLPGAGFGPSAAVIEVHPDGGVDVRRDPSVPGGDEDEFFGSPTAGRLLRFTSDDVEAGDAAFRLGPLEVGLRQAVPARAPRERGAVNRTPYRPVRDGARVLGEVASPPTAPRPSRMAITSFVVPLVSGVGMAVLLGRLYFLCIVLLAPVALAVVSAVQRRRGRRSFAVDRANYRQLIADAAHRARAEAASARADAHAALPSSSMCCAAVLDGRASLWQRAADGPHLLRARVGVAARPAVVSVPIERGGDDQLRAEAAVTLAAACAPPGPVPVDVDVDAAVAVGLCGPLPDALGLVRSLLAQHATHHGPEDVVVVAALTPGSLGALDGLSWLPHTRSAASPVVGAHVAVWADEIDRMIGGLVDIAARRAATPGRCEVPRLLLVVDQASPVERGALGQLLQLAPRGGIRVLWFGDDPTLVPRQCRVIVHVASGQDRSRVESTDPDVQPEDCSVETLDRDRFGELARALAPCHDAASPARAGSIPAEVTLVDVLGSASRPEGVADAWAGSDGTSLAAPIGIGPSGSTVVDLVADGPHALVAGTSGSGKSELLQTWVASMAAHHPPERCTFLFVDYKGGATAAPLEHLPHTVGSVSNLDARLAQRALVSLRAELDARMALFEGRAKDLSEFAAVAPDECPPRLVIVVDEFATLVKEIPDFVAGVVDVAQRGRSLGIHLVLATQRPAGAVNDAIRANAPLRVALRVVDGADSRSVIETEDAAGIPARLRGRGFVKLGHGTITGVQVAWATAPAGGPDERANADRLAVTPPPGPRVDHDGGSQLCGVVDAVTSVHRERGGRPPRPAWVPELPNVVDLASLGIDAVRWSDDPGREVVIGLADDPARQAQYPAVVDIEATAGLIVVGTGGSGRTTAIRSAVASAVARADVDQVHVVAFDFAGRSLSALAGLPHTRAAICGDDLEGAAREIEWLADEIERRRELLAEARAVAWSDLVNRPGRPPRVLVAIDGFAGLRSGLDTGTAHPWWQRLQRVLIDGRQVGIHPLVAADRRNDISQDVLGSVTARLVLRMADPDAMTALGVPRAVARAADLPVGRGFLGGLEVQVAVLDRGGEAGPTAATEAAALDRIGAARPRRPAPRTPGLPSVLRSWPAGLTPAPGEAPIGVDEHGRLVAVSLTEPVVVTGPHGSGRSNLLRVVADHAAGSDLPVVVAAADARSPVAADGPETTDWLTDLLTDLLADGSAERTVLIVDDAERIEDPGVAAAVALWLERRYPAVVAVDRIAFGRTLTGLVGALRRIPSLVILQPEGSADVEAIVGRRVRFRPGTEFPVGRAVVRKNRTLLICQAKHHENT